MTVSGMLHCLYKLRTHSWFTLSCISIHGTQLSVLQVFSSLSACFTALSAAGYLTTMFGTLYAALIMHSYVMSVVCCVLQVRLVHLSISSCDCHCHVSQCRLACLVLQLVALLYYVASYFPGGTQGVKFVMLMATQATKQCLYGCRQAIFGKG